MPSVELIDCPTGFSRQVADCTSWALSGSGFRRKVLAPSLQRRRQSLTMGCTASQESAVREDTRYNGVHGETTTKVRACSMSPYPSCTAGVSVGRQPKRLGCMLVKARSWGAQRSSDRSEILPLISHCRWGRVFADDAPMQEPIQPPSPSKIKSVNSVLGKPTEVLPQKQRELLCLTTVAFVVPLQSCHVSSIRYRSSISNIKMSNT